MSRLLPVLVCLTLVVLAASGWVILHRAPATLTPVMRARFEVAPDRMQNVAIRQQHLPVVGVDEPQQFELLFNISVASQHECLLARNQRALDGEVDRSLVRLISDELRR